jgi:uncharacterized delta-60 repeat protein
MTLTLSVEALEERTLLNGGALDPMFGAGGKVTTPLFGPLTWGESTGAFRVSRVAVAPDGKIVLGGGIDNRFGTRTFLTRYNADGSLDTSFGSSGTCQVPLSMSGVSFSGVDDLVIQQDGKIVVSVHYDWFGGAGGELERLNGDGSLDASFDGVSLGGGVPTRRLAVQPDGKLFVVTYFTGVIPGGTAFPPSPVALVRLDPDGRPDPSFGTNGRVTDNFPTPEHLAFEPGGKSVGLTRDVQSGNTFLTLTRYTSNFSLDPTFGNGGRAAAGSEPLGQTSQEYLATQADGKLVVVVAPIYRSGSTVLLERFTPDGLPDGTLGDGTGAVTAPVPSSVSDVLVQPDGKILMVLDPIAYNNNFMLVRFTAPGQPDPAFGTNGTVLIRFGNQDSTAVAAALQPDGNIVVAGSLGYSYVSNATTSAVVRLFGAEPPDPGLSPNQRFVTQVYRDLLQRPAEAAGLAFWSGLIDQGVSRGQVVLEIEASLEYRQTMVRHMYREVLRREVEPYGLSVWADYLGHGGTVEQVRASLLGSPEYFAGGGQGRDDDFLMALYDDVLDRPFVDSAGQQTWLPLLAGGTPRDAVAQAVLNSEEGCRRVVAGLYAQYLGRPVDDFGLGLFTQALQQGARLEDVVATLLASDEYQARG